VDASEPASVHVIIEHGRTRVVLSGEVDADLAADLADATADAEAAGLPIDIDAQHVTFMDSSGIAFLARIATRAQQPVRVLRAPESVRFLLEVTRIHELLEVVAEPDAESAGETDDEPDLPTIGPAGRQHPEPPDSIA
jgi:anti-anti-sigma factor